MTVCAKLKAPALGELNVRLGGDRLTAGVGKGVPPPPPPPPPPQAAQAPAMSSAIPNTHLVCRRPGAAKLKRVARASNPANAQGHPSGRRKLAGTLPCPLGETLGGIPLCRLGIAAVAGPVVLIVMVAVKAEGPVMLNPGGKSHNSPRRIQSHTIEPQFQ